VEDRYGATMNVYRWLERQLQQPTLDRERLEAAVERGDAAEVRRLLARQPFSDDQRRLLDDLLRRWEATLAAE
jgi:hypothetical protein